jgi:ABC-type multidrug transport system fused ATPase/permease subunit
MIPLVRGLAIFSRWKMINIIRGQLDIILNLPVEKEIDLAEIKGDIQLRDIGYLSKSDSFSYWVFKNINLDIPPCSVVTIVSDSKADAEKLLNILAAIIRPTTGEYLIDGKNVDAYQNYQLRTKITYLSKAGTLFQGSIMDNLSSFNQTLIPVAMRFSNMLGLDPVIAKLPAGYDTLVGDKAVETLPVSVINLIYIIRALVNKPKIILLDEADMDLDAKLTEKLIELLKILKEIATIVILPKNGDVIHFSDVVYELKNKELKRVPFNAAQ